MAESVIIHCEKSNDWKECFLKPSQLLQEMGSCARLQAQKLFYQLYLRTFEEGFHSISFNFVTIK
jgi:hypothetical protein